MKRLLRISALVLLYCLSTAKSCSNQEENDAAREQVVVTAVRDSIRSAFDSGSLSPETLGSMEESAKLKLLELSDYLHILSDSTLDLGYRQKAAEMVHGLFISGLTEKGFPAGFPEFDSVKVLQSLHRTSDSSYAGCLSFSKSRTVDIFAIKRTTIIGADTLKNWKIFLGVIK